jgi:UDP-N-acetylmuramate--L-alanine ligase
VKDGARHILFLEIAGHAMRGVALAARDRGHHVTGLDEKAVPPGSDWLDERGIEWTRTASPELLDGVDLVVISGGTPAAHAVLEEARRRGIPITSFAEYLGDLTRGKHVIAISGTHGKTTTTSLITWLLHAAGHEPDYLIGIRPFNFDSSARLVGADTFVVEGDEYNASSLAKHSKVQFYHPDVLVLTSVEHDHPDLFPDLAAVVKRFKEVVGKLPAGGRLVAWAEDPAVAEVAEAAPCAVTTYGLSRGDYTAANIVFEPAGLTFDVMSQGAPLGRLTIPLYGRHNVLNALAATVVALGEGLAMEQIIAAAPDFRGAFRRFNQLTPAGAPVTVIDDYAHHPTEVATTLEAARLHFPGRRIVAVFRPHTYSRTEALLAEYHHSFDSAHEVFMTDIEGARETGKTHTVTTQDILRGLSMPAHYAADRAALIKDVKEATRPGDVIVCMTVSGLQNLAEELAEALK